jgi:superfamily II DNA or RNA helicase/HKD family nuclease
MLSAFSVDLLASVNKGFIDNTATATDAYLPQLLINDKVRSRTVLSTVDQQLNQCDEFWFSVAFATSSGVTVIINTLEALKQKGISGRVLVSQYNDFTQPEALRKLLQFENITLRIATTGNFHAKGYLFKQPFGYNLLIGSSNLTSGALQFNKEWNLKVSATATSHLMADVLETFQQAFDNATVVDEAFITTYEEIYRGQTLLRKKLAKKIASLTSQAVVPNAMQKEALANLATIRDEGKDKALLISATGTGKTYLSAFDVQKVNPAKFLFIVHRTNIAKAAMKTFKQVFGNTRTMGLYSGATREHEADFLFCTVQTMALPHHLTKFAPDHFDYIVIDETHRSGAASYQTILDHFKPKFLLGMTATPERTDGFDIFKQFDYNIAYEIRLQRALEEQMLCPFHYFGVTDITVDDKPIEEDAAFSLLVADERVNHILEKATFYGSDSGCTRGLVFCRTVKECEALSEAFNQRGLRTLVLSGASSEDDRAAAITRLESDEESVQLDYIFTVDIFNEGIDIPRLNQVIMLRPTQSAIVFVQQLGRGLRKAEGKEYLTVIDFIGNYRNNYLVPIALFGDTSYNRDTLRKLMAAGSSMVPGESTVNFDAIAKQKIYDAIDSASINGRRDLIKDYNLLKFRLGRPPMMMDFIVQGARDPFQYVLNFGSFFNCAVLQEGALQGAINADGVRLLELISENVANAKRIEEVVILLLLLEHPSISFEQVQQYVAQNFSPATSTATLASCLSNLNFDFRRKHEDVVNKGGGSIHFALEFQALLANPNFKTFLVDALQFAQARYAQYCEQSTFIEGFFLYQKYSRRDVCRILNWEKDESATVYGYKVKDEACPLFVNYHKADDIAMSTNYDDSFLNNFEFKWMSKSKRRKTSPDVSAILNHHNSGLRLPLFIKKYDGEGDDHYYMGEVIPQLDSVNESEIPDDAGEMKPVVKMRFTMVHPVEENMYNYITAPQTVA